MPSKQAKSRAKGKGTAPRASGKFSTSSIKKRKTTPPSKPRSGSRKETVDDSQISFLKGTIFIQNRILEMIAQNKPLDKTLETLARNLEKYAPPMRCAILYLDPENKTLHPKATPSLPANLVKVLDGYKIGPEAGSCGSAAYRNKMVIIDNIAEDPRTEGFRHLVLRAGFQGCFSIPVHNAFRKVLGTICLFLPEPRKPTSEEKEFSQTAARLAGIAFDRDRAEREVREIQTRLEEEVLEGTQTMTEAIRQLQDEIVQRKIIERSLKESNEKLQILTSHQESVREEERTRISREIHDELGQMLTTLKMEISLLDERREEENLPIQDDLKSMTTLVETTLHTVRRISTELRPGILDVLGLAEALEWQAQEFQKRTHIQIKTDIQRLPENTEKRFSTACFRICQEALTNVARHARATRVFISLTWKNHAVELKVQDNGLGITPEQASRLTSLGVIGMRERAQNLGGQLEIQGTPKKGTLVYVSFPLERRT